MSSIKQNSGRITQAAIAQKLGLDQSTVSACLNNAPRAERYSPEVRELVAREAERLNYRPHLFASQMRVSHPKMILLCLATYMDAYASVVGEAFAESCEDLGYHVLTMTVDRVKHPAERLKEIVGPHGIHALCLIGTAVNIFPPDELTRLLDEKMKVVLALRSHPDPRVMYVTANNEDSARIAYKYLYDRGMRNTWVLGDDSPITASGVGLRAPAFIKAAAEVGGPEPLLISAENPHSFEGRVPGYEEIRIALANRPAPDALFAVRDFLAYGAIQAFQDSGLRVGQNISVIGNDDIWPSRMISPALTTVRQPLRRMGAAAAKMLLDALHADFPEQRAIEFSSTIVERASVHKIPTSQG